MKRKGGNKVREREREKEERREDKGSQRGGKYVENEGKKRE